MRITMDNYQELLGDVEKHKHRACQFIDTDEANRRQLVDLFCRGIDEMDENTRFIRLNEADYTDFAAFLRTFLLTMMKDPDFNPGRRKITQEEVEEMDDEVDLCFFIESVLKSNKRQYYIFLILEDHQASPAYWSETNYGWMRGLFCESPLLGVLLTSSTDAYSVSQLPRGSSPFANIFDLF